MKFRRFPRYSVAIFALAACSTARAPMLAIALPSSPVSARLVSAEQQQEGVIVVVSAYVHNPTGDTLRIPNLCGRALQLEYERDANWRAYGKAGTALPCDMTFWELTLPPGDSARLSGQFAGLRGKGNEALGRWEGPLPGRYRVVTTAFACYRNEQMGCPMRLHSPAFPVSVSRGS